METTCQCELAGWCERYKREMGVRAHQICQGTSGLSPAKEEAYRANWRKQTPKIEAGKAASKKKNCGECRGPGTELKKLLAWWTGYRAGKCSKCNDRACRMDKWGVAGCREHLPEILGWLREAAWEKGVLIGGLVAHDAILRPLVEQAIANFERTAQDTSNPT